MFYGPGRILGLLETFFPTEGIASTFAFPNGSRAEEKPDDEQCRPPRDRKLKTLDKS